MNLHDPEGYIASLCSLLVSYPLWAGESALRKGAIESKFVPPSIGVLTPLLESEVRSFRYAAGWERDAQEQLLRIEGPKTPRPTMEELKAKHGENWGIKQHDKPRYQFPDLAELCAEVGIDPESIKDAEKETWKPVRSALAEMKLDPPDHQRARYARAAE